MSTGLDLRKNLGSVLVVTRSGLQDTKSDKSVGTGLVLDGQSKRAQHSENSQMVGRKSTHNLHGRMTLVLSWYRACRSHFGTRLGGLIVLPSRHSSGQASRHALPRTGLRPLAPLVLGSTFRSGGPEGRRSVMKMSVIPLVLANKALEWLTGRIPTDVDLLERLLIAEAEMEIVKAENKILRIEITKKVNAIMKRVEEK